MSLDDIRTRTARRKAAGLIPEYTPTPGAPKRVALPLAPCAHEGNVLERCPSCSGGGRHVRECDVHERCTHEPVSPKVMDCRRCRREGLGYAPEGGPGAAPAPVVTRIDPDRLAPAADGRRFNASLLDPGGRRLLAYRAGWTRSRVHVATLGADLQPVATVPLELPHPRCAAGQEDPRLFVFDGAPHLAFAGLQWDRGRLIVSQMLARLAPDLTAERVWEPRYPQRTYPMEKNWGFFEADGLNCVYTIRPHRVLALDVPAGTAAPAHETPGPPADLWPGWELRGGAPPVRVGAEFYSFFHGWKRSKRGGTPHGDWYDYATGVYTFEARPPFAVKRVARAPLWLPDPARRHLNVTRDKAVIYPSGAVLDGARWLVSAGHQDAECLVGAFAAAGVERALEPVP